MLKSLINWLAGQTQLQRDSATINQIGGRDNLEDAVGQAIVNPQTGCWLVADGVGGQGAGEVAAQLAINCIEQGFHSQADCSIEGLHSLLQTAHEKVAAARQPGTPCADMASTVVALLIKHDQAWWGHVGDSRLYHFRHGKILHRTEDQSLANLLMARGALKPADSVNFTQRNVILQALGQDKPLEIPVTGPVSIKAGDSFLLCTDGVWELMSDDELLASGQNSVTANDWITVLQDCLESRALKKNHADQPADNYSAVAIKVAGYKN